MEVIITSLRKFYKVLLAAVVVVIFFSVYNKYLIDHTLQDLEVSLAQTKEATDIKAVVKISGLLDFAIVNELTREKISSENLIYLTLSKEIAKEDAKITQIQDLGFFLKELIADKKATRSALLQSLDKITAVLNDISGSIRIVYNKYFRPMVATTVITKISLLNSALQLESQGKFMESVIFYKDFIEANPNAVDINYVKLKMAQNMLKVGRYAGAKKVCIEILNSSTDKNEVNIAKSLLAKTKINNINKTKKIIDTLKNKLPSVLQPEDKQKIYFKIGILSKKIMDLKSAQEAFKEVIDIDPKSELSIRTAFNLGWAYKLNGQIEESSAVFKEITEKYSESRFVEDSIFQIADNLKKQGKFEEAIELFKTLYDTRLGKLARFEVGYTQLYKMNDAASAKKSFGEMGKDFIQTSLGKKLTRMIADLGRKFRLAGFKLLTEGDTQGARAQFKKALAINPNDAKAYGEIARSYAMERKFDEGIKWAEKGIQANPEDEYPYAIIAKIYEQRGELKKAIEYYRESLQYTPNYPQVCYNMGVDYNLLGEYDKAIEILTEAKKYAPDFAEVRNNLGFAYWNKGKYYRAIEEYKKAIELKPDYTDALYNLALAYKTQKKFAEAEKLLRKIITLKPTSIAARRELENLTANIISEE